MLTNISNHFEQYEPLEKYGDVLSVEEVAEILGVSKQTVRACASVGELPGKKIQGRRRWFFLKKSLIEFLEGGAND